LRTSTDSLGIGLLKVRSTLASLYRTSFHSRNCSPAFFGYSTTTLPIPSTTESSGSGIFADSHWLAVLTAHIPNAGEHLVRYYGWYSNVNRGKWWKEGPSPIEEFSEVIPAAAKRAWARLITQVYDVDPLVCPRCAGSMRIITFSEQPAVIDLPVPRTADREDPAPSRLVAGPGP
jgi:hypothetical protein